jgi:hypothetical protein
MKHQPNNMTEATQAITSLIELVTEIISRSDMDDISKVMAIDTASESAVRIAEIYGGCEPTGRRRVG